MLELAYTSKDKLLNTLSGKKPQFNQILKVNSKLIFKNLRRRKPEIFLEKHVSPRTQQLLNKKRRLQSILAELKLLAQAKKNLEALQPSLKLQEKILN